MFQVYDFLYLSRLVGIDGHLDYQATFLRLCKFATVAGILLDDVELLLELRHVG